MERGFFEPLDFFPGAQDEKQVNGCMPVVSSSAQLPGSEHLGQGIFQDEESVDFSAILEAYNSEHSVVPTSSIPETAVSSRNPAPLRSGQEESITSSSNFQNFPGYLASDISLGPSSMYGSESYANPMHGQMEVSTSPTSLGVDCTGVPTTPSPHVVQINSSVMSGHTFTTLHPAPGKAQRGGKATRKHLVDKGSSEYRQKRNRNNIAVRKSREKTKVRVMDTEKRVKELEDENTHLQSKIALLTKELNVLKSLFTSAGVSQPSSFLIKDEGVMTRK